MGLMALYRFYIDSLIAQGIPSNFTGNHTSWKT